MYGRGIDIHIKIAADVVQRNHRLAVPFAGCGIYIAGIVARISLEGYFRGGFLNLGEIETVLSYIDNFFEIDARLNIEEELSVDYSEELYESVEFHLAEQSGERRSKIDGVGRASRNGVGSKSHSAAELDVNISRHTVLGKEEFLIGLRDAEIGIGL